MLLAAAAPATDLPRKMPIKAVPAPASHWAGLHIGGDYGTSLAQS